MWWVRGEAPTDGRDCDDMLNSKDIALFVGGWVVIDEYRTWQNNDWSGGGATKTKNSATCLSATIFIYALFNRFVHNSDYSSK
jgi:hypothetical protein